MPLSKRRRDLFLATALAAGIRSFTYAASCAAAQSLDPAGVENAINSLDESLKRAGISPQQNRAGPLVLGQSNIYSGSVPELVRIIGRSTSAAPDIADKAAVLLSQLNASERVLPEWFAPHRGGPAPSFETLRAEYARDFKAMTFKPARRAQVEWYVKTLIANKTRYASVGKSLGIPWYFVGTVHALEASLNFRAHLHNGDVPLTERTKDIPANHPTIWLPPSDWESSARDALTLEGFAGKSDWSLERTLYRFEAYNGFGSRRHGIKTPYLWSFSNLYTAGKYVRDRVWDPNAVSQQCGAAVIMNGLAGVGAISFS